ncbi:MAG: RHS repeat domain-containing protein [Campylobacterota bacterium]|nr:RHS repeat domain-containing protein [Campylobacterota bacterium]
MFRYIFMVFIFSFFSFANIPPLTQTTYSPSNKLTLTEYPDKVNCEAREGTLGCGTTESKSYDAMDNLISQTNVEQETTSYSYDDADRLVETTYPDGTTTSTEVDGAGRTIATSYCHLTPILLTNMVANLEALYSCFVSGSLNAFKVFAFMIAVIQTVMFVATMAYIMAIPGGNLVAGTLFATVMELIQGEMQGSFLRDMC